MARGSDNGMSVVGRIEGYTRKKGWVGVRHRTRMQTAQELKCEQSRTVVHLLVFYKWPFGIYTCF